MLIDDATVIAASGLLAAGTLTAGIDTLMARPPRTLVSAAKTLWCISGLLALTAVVLNASRLASDTPSGASMLAIAGGGCVATAAVSLLRLFGRAPSAISWRDQRGREEERSVDGVGLS